MTLIIRRRKKLYLIFFPGGFDLGSMFLRGVFTQKMQEYVPLRNMQGSIAASQKFLKTKYDEECCNDKITWLSSKIKLNKSILLIMKKIVEAGITDYEHLLSPENQYLSKL